MTSDKTNENGRTVGDKPIDSSKPGQERPGWSRGLRQLYDSVVEEPLPDNFKDLLSKLDTKD